MTAIAQTILFMMAVLAVVALWVVVSVLMVVVAAEHVHQGEAAVQSARQGLSADGILSGAPVGSLVTDHV